MTEELTIQEVVSRLEKHIQTHKGKREQATFSIAGVELLLTEYKKLKEAANVQDTTRPAAGPTIPG